MNFIAIFATIFGTIGGFANVPQIYKIFKRKSAKDISIITYTIVFIGTLTWLLYGIQLHDFPLIFCNVFGLFFVGLVILGWFIYGAEKNKKKS
jgi:MtN3 and saliva related transmembrane protein